MPRLIVFNKPYGVLCQFSDKDGRPVLADFINLPGVYPAGRLDHDSEGLLLTDDGALQARIADPRWKLPKTYWAQVEGEVTTEALARLRRGVELNDGPTLPAGAERLEPADLWPRDPPIRYRASIPTSWIALTLREGRNRQVRRMTAAVGFPTLRLLRVAIGPWRVDGLAPGEWREVWLEEAEVRALFPGAEPGAGKPGRRPGDRPLRAGAGGSGAGAGAAVSGKTAAASDRPLRHRSPSHRPSGPPRSPTPSSRKGRGS